MKCLAVFFLALGAICAVSALPHGMFFYQGMPGYYRQPVHRMYVQYQQPYRSTRKAGGVSAYVAGDQIATGTYLKDSEFEQEADVPAIPEGQNDGAVSIAEAYPAEEEADVGASELDAEPELNIDEQPPKSPKVPKELVPPKEDEITPNEVAVPKRKNKPRVELTPIEDDDEEEEEDEVVPVKKTYRRKSNGSPSNPVVTYFPVQFGNTNGGAIAVANSFSTGKSGSATSHAIAYGSPASKKSKRRQSSEE